MTIEPISFYNTSGQAHRAGLYVVDIASRNDPNQKWYKWTYEEFSNGMIRTLDNISNYTGFFDKERKSISFSLDLHSISFPSEYVVGFNARNGFNVDGRYCTLIDNTNWDQIPPPRYFISILPHSIVLRPGEETNLELQVATTRKGLSSDVSLSATPSGNIEVSLNPSNLILQSEGTAASILHVRAPGKILSWTDPLTAINCWLNDCSSDLPKPYEIPISAKVSFQSGTFISQGSDILIPSISLPYSVNQNYNNLTVTLLKQQSFGEIFSDLWNKFGVSTLIAGALGAVIGIAADRFRRYRRADRKTSHESQSQ